MSRQCIAIVYVVLTMLLVTASPAKADDTGPEAFVTDIVAKEIDGDVLARRDQVIFSDGKQIEGDCGCWVPREMWLPNENVVIVSSWSSLGGQKAGKNEVIVKIRFHTIARGELKELGKPFEYPSSEQIIFLPRNAFDETVSYRVRHTKEGWRLIDPPLPRVSTKAVRDRLAMDKEGNQEARDAGRVAGEILRSKINDISAKYLEAKEATLDYLDAVYKK